MLWMLQYSHSSLVLVPSALGKMRILQRHTRLTLLLSKNSDHHFQVIVTERIVQAHWLPRSYCVSPRCVSRYFSKIARQFSIHCLATCTYQTPQLLINPDSYSFQAHVTGLVDILRRLYSQSHGYDATIQAIYYGNYYAEVCHSAFLRKKEGRNLIRN